MSLRPLTPAYIKKRLNRLEPKVRLAILNVIDACESLPRVRYVVFDVSAEFSWDHLPISVSTYDEDKRELDCTIHCQELIERECFLEPKYEYPLGRIDLAGLDTTGDYELVLVEIVTFVRSVWLSLGDLDHCFDAYIGNVLVDENHEMVPSPLVALKSGEKESVCFSFD